MSLITKHLVNFMEGKKINYTHKLQGYEINRWKSIEQPVKNMVDEINLTKPRAKSKYL